MITSFPAAQLANMAGLQSFIFSPYQNINALPAVALKLVGTDVSFYSGYAWLTGYSTISELVFTEKASPDDNGQAYDWLITGFMPGDNDTLANLMEQMSKSRHLVVTQDNSGNKRIIGMNAPLDFAADFGSGKQAGTDTKGYLFSFSGRSITRAPRFNA